MFCDAQQDMNITPLKAWEFTVLSVYKSVGINNSSVLVLSLAVDFKILKLRMKDEFGHNRFCFQKLCISAEYIHTSV